MARVEILAAALADRRSELEQATVKLAEHSALLEQATAELAASNGDFTIWEAIDSRCRFVRRQVERYQGIVQQCGQNVDCASKALEVAQRQAKITELEALEVLQADLDRKALSKAAELYHQACTLLASVQPSVELAKQRAEQLRMLGETRPLRHPIWELWLTLIQVNPGQGPAYWNDASKFETDLVGHIQDAMKLQPMPERQLLSLRQSFGDTSAVVPPLPKVEPPPVCGPDYTSERFYGTHGYRVRVENNTNGKADYRLLLPDSPSMMFGESGVVSDQVVQLAFGLAGRFVRLDDGREMLLAPAKPSLASRVVDGACELLGLTADQSSL